MKKIFAIFLVLAVCAAAFACGRRDDKNTTGILNTTLNTTMGGIIPDLDDLTTDNTVRPGGTEPSAGVTDTTVNTDGTNGTIPQATGGGTTVR